MLLNFRQGMVGYQQLPDYIQLNSMIVSLDTTISPIIITFAHGSTNYLFTELESVSNAWNTTFNTSTSYWLYWDISLITGLRTFGFTLLLPTFGSTFPGSPSLDQHYFSIPDMKMYYWNGESWVECIRVFAGSLINGILHKISLGTQVQINLPSAAGEILFDSNGNPLIKYLEDGTFEFATTNDDTQSGSQNLTNIKINQLDISGLSNSYIPKYYCVKFIGKDAYNRIQIQKASYFDVNNAAYAITLDDMNVGEVKQLITHGFIQDFSWYWNYPPFTPLFVGGDGEVTTYVSNTLSIQKVGHVVNVNTIFVNIEQQIILK